MCCFSRAIEVDRAGNKFFSGSGFTADEDGGGTVGYLNNLFIDKPHGVTVADHVVDAVAVA